MKRFISAAGFIAAGIGLYAGWRLLFRIRSEDAPIRVRNGSLDLLSGSSLENTWSWAPEDGDSEDSSPCYSHEPAEKFSDPNRYLSVTVTGGSEGTGKKVTVKYSDKFEVHLKRGKSGARTYRTKVRPRNNKLNRQGPFLLRYDPAGGGYICSVSVDNEELCTFQKSDDPTIEIVPVA